MHTVIAICTYRRPDGIERLLKAIEKIELPAGVGDDEIGIVVIDNDAGADGLAVVDALKADHRFNLEAACVPGDGISEARNASVAMALAHKPQYVAFLDDDEWPEVQWLSELVRVLEAAGADAVGGPTLSVFPEDAPEALVNNPYFGADMGLADGVSCQLQAAGNFLIRADTLSTTTPQCFHPDFAHSGGEDLAFFTQLNQKGCSMVWASMAKVHEDVPANRLTHDWLRTRIIGIANSRVRVMQMLKPGLIPSAVRGLKTVALFAQAGLFSLVGIVIPSQREAAEQLRWKFIGKFTAHMQKKTVRPEGH